MRYSSRGALRIDLAENVCPAMAVPITVKMPEPITAPIPSAVSDQGPSDFLSCCSGLSESEISLSIDFLAKSWLARRPPHNYRHLTDWCNWAWKSGRITRGHT